MADEDHATLHPLLHRWFVQYNPLYLLSAALVLVGAHLLYRDLLAAGYLVGQLGVPAIAEVYAWSLIGGAALLTRIDLRRPAVLLALLAVLFQGDLTLVVETSVYLGGAGTIAVVVWLASFAAKLRALAWALRLELSRSAYAVPILGAAALVLVTRSLSVVPRDTASLVLGAASFAVVAAALWTHREVRSRSPLDAWGHTVLRRGVAATWATWLALAAMHVAFWATDHRVPWGVMVPVALLLSTRFARREAHVWAGVGAALVWAEAAVPHAMTLTAVLAGCTLVLHAFRHPHRREANARQAPSVGPYRESEVADEPRAPLPCPIRFGRAPAAMRRRLLTGTLVAAHLAVWTLGWSGGPWPSHVLALDAALALVAVVGWSKLRAREPAVASAALVGHHAIAAGWIVAPETRLAWGITSVGAGFGLLLVSLAVAYRLRPRAVAAARADDVAG